MANPLNASDKKAIDGALAAIKSVEGEIIKAKQAGLNVGPQEERLKELKDKLQKIKAAYFPTGA
jgi:hypothetical protein